jgi:demethylmenaquinone methyltransferase / 2-methoxy-6-polyprenyl-1,4-benzoquinol methylase
MKQAAMKVEQAIWETQGEAKRIAVQGMFAEIAPTYDKANSIMSFRLHHRWRALAVESINLQVGEKVLDLCCGTGDFLPLLRTKVGNEGHLIGIDFCAPMLVQSRKKDANSVLCLADASRIPLPDASVDAVTVGWGMRNVPDVDQVHAEIFRVLKPAGRFVSVDMADPETRIGVTGSRIFRSKMLRALGTWLGLKEAYIYLDESTKRFKTRQQLCDSMESAGLTQIRFRNLMMGNICIHQGTKPK